MCVGKILVGDIVDQFRDMERTVTLTINSSVATLVSDVYLVDIGEFMCTCRIKKVWGETLF